MKKDRILVTGGTGYIGSHTVVELQNAGYPVVIIDNLSNSNRNVLDGIERITGIRPDFVEADCTDMDALKKLFADYPDIKGIINFAASKAVGESVQKPILYYRNNLNTLLNLLLVIRFGMSVEGVAIATVVANIINASFIIYWLTREDDPYKLNIRKIRLSMPELKKMLQIGVPAGLQGMVFSTANIFIQSAINQYGSDAIAGSAAALNYEVYCYFIVSAFCQAAVAFISQNYGAGKYDRCRQAFRICMWLSVITCGFANVMITWQDSFFIGIFSSSPEVLHFASIRLHYVLLLQFIASSYEISGSAMRGLGYSMTPTILTIFGTCVLRLLWVYTVNERLHDFKILLCIYPISWIVTGSAVYIAYRIVQRKVFSEHDRKV